MTRKTVLLMLIILSSTLLLAGLFSENGLLNAHKKKMRLEETQRELELKIVTTTSNEEIDIKQGGSIYTPSGNELMKNTSNRLRIICASLICLVLSIPILIMFINKERNIKIDEKKFEEVDMNTDAGINKIIKRLNENKIVIMPCDTIYGICALANEANKKKLENIKKRDQSKSFIILCTKDTARELVADNCPETVYNFWPAPLTVIVNSAKKNERIAIRVPKNKKLEKILESVGAIYSTSVNISGEKSINDVDEIISAFSQSVDVIAYDKTSKQTEESTILDVSCYPFKIIREGSISKKTIKEKISL